MGNIPITPTNTNPNAENDLASTTNLGPVIIDVLANDSDADSDPLTVTGASVDFGTVTINPDGTITFTPLQGFGGVAEISYTISDGNGLSDTATVQVTVRDGVIDGTSAGDVIDAAYLGDPEGDVVDGGDAFLDGEAPQDDIIYSAQGNDFVDAGEGDDEVFAGTGNDTILGGAGKDKLFGNEGNDTIIGGAGADAAYGGDGDDIIDTSNGTPIPDVVDAGSGTPPLTPDADPDDDRDFVDGGAGNDTITTGDDADVIFGGMGDDVIDGGIDDDFIRGDAGADTLIGGAGNDVLIGGADADQMSGGEGADLFIVDNAQDGFGDVIEGSETGDDFDTLDLTGAGPLRIVYSSDDAEAGVVEFLNGDDTVAGSLIFSEIENVVPCFTPGTLIATPRGEILVEELRAGDKIITRDNGIQELSWIGAKQMDGRVLQQNRHLQPVLIKQGALGHGLPERDMLVSPNHRMLVNNDRVSLYFDEDEVLVAAKHLVNPSHGVQAVQSAGTTYIHFMFENHEVVLANGAWTESFQPGDYTLNGVGNAQRQEIFSLFPDLEGHAGREAYTAARLTLKKHEAKMLFK